MGRGIVLRGRSRCGKSGKSTAGPEVWCQNPRKSVDTSRNRRETRGKNLSPRIWLFPAKQHGEESGTRGKNVSPTFRSRGAPFPDFWPRGPTLPRLPAARAQPSPTFRSRDPSFPDLHPHAAETPSSPDDTPTTRNLTRRPGHSRPRSTSHLGRRGSVPGRAARSHGCGSAGVRPHLRVVRPRR